TRDRARNDAPRGASCRWCCSRLKVVRVVRDDLVAVVRHEHEVLEAQTAVAGPVEPRLDRDHVARHQVVADATHGRQFVHLEPYTMAEAMEEAVYQNLARLLVELGLVARAVEDVAHLFVELPAVHARLDALGGRIERLL